MDDLIRQLTAEDLAALEASARGADPVEVSALTLRSLLNEIAFNRQRAGAGVLEITSLVSLKDGKPYLTLEFGAVRIQLSADEAIAHAGRILEVAAGASADAFLVAFLRGKIGISDQQTIGALLQDFRAYRDGNEAAE
jgi:hypothetical protein